MKGQNTEKDRYTCGENGIWSVVSLLFRMSILLSAPVYLSPVVL